VFDYPEIGEYNDKNNFFERSKRMVLGKKSREIDMTNGPLLGKVLLFSLPLMLSGILQLLYNAADIVVVGRYCGNTSLAAVGSTGALVALIINVFVGLSIGAGVTVANRIGANDRKGVHDAVHTAVAVSLISGVVCGLIGVTLSRTFLVMMGTPSNVLDLSSLYLKIYFAGMPALMFYNFGSAILRAMGDTKRPLYYLTISGAVNVVLNLFFVIVFHMGVAGVALATVISQVLSATLVVICMLRSHGAMQLCIKELHIHKDKLFQIIRIGLPAGIQGSIFSISNVIIQSSINAFGSDVMAGNSAAANIEGFIYTAMNSMYQACLAFAGQNMGAKKYKRVGKVLMVCLAYVCTFGIGLSVIATIFNRQLLGIYTTDPNVIEYGIKRMSVICVTYFTCGIMDVTVGQLRGMGFSVMPMLVSLAGVCGIRIVWIFTVFKANPSQTTLYLSYPISWIVTGAVHIICFIVVYRRLRRNNKELIANET